MSVRILVGDARARLAELPAGSVQCVVTSPPYWQLRDYGVAGQIGLEPSFPEYLAALVDVFRAVRRVLRPDGTLWLNMGDAYAGSWGAQSRGAAPSDKSTLRGNGHIGGGPKLKSLSAAPIAAHPKGTLTGSLKRTPGKKPKDLMMMPARLALALQEDGWYLRQQMPWIKRNPMPESARDRPTVAVEYVYLLSRGPRYFYDGGAVAVPASPRTHARVSTKMPDGWDTGPGGHGAIHRTGREKGRRVEKPDKQTGHGRRHAGFNARWEGRDNAAVVDGPIRRPKRVAPDGMRRANDSFENATCGAVLETRARRNSDWFVESWQGLLADDDGGPLAFVVNTHGFAEAHFATFPPGLVAPCIRAGCPAGGIVLDPFGGAGTVGLVADRLGRDAILIELNPAYADIARRRIEGDSPLFAEVGG